MKLHISVSRHYLFILCTMMRLLNHISPPFDFLEQFGARESDTLPFPPIGGAKPKDGAAFGDERASQRTRAHPNGFSVRPQPSRRRTDFIDRPNAHPSTPANLGRKGQDVNRSHKARFGLAFPDRRVERASNPRADLCTAASLPPSQPAGSR